jgi:hypothetical protein
MPAFRVQVGRDPQVTFVSLANCDGLQHRLNASICKAENRRSCTAELIATPSA